MALYSYKIIPAETRYAAGEEEFLAVVTALDTSLDVGFDHRWKLLLAGRVACLCRDHLVAVESHSLSAAA